MSSCPPTHSLEDIILGLLMCHIECYFDFTYLLTAWCRVLLEKITGLQLVKKFLHFTEPEGSLPHSQVSSPIQSIYPHPTSCRSILILSTHLRLGLPSGSFPPVSPPRPYTSPSPHPYAPHVQPF